MAGTENFADFRCSDPAFEEYLRVSALYDQNAGMGRTYTFMHEGRIAGYIVLAAAHVPDTEQKHFNIDTYGPVPGLLISHLTTHQECERRGVGRNMVLWAIDYARKLAENVGRRIVVVGADPEVAEFYEKIGFVRAAAQAGAGGAAVMAVDSGCRKGRPFFLRSIFISSPAPGFLRNRRLPCSTYWASFWAWLMRRLDSAVWTGHAEINKGIVRKQLTKGCAALTRQAPAGR